MNDLIEFAARFLNDWLEQSLANRAAIAAAIGVPFLGFLWAVASELLRIGRKNKIIKGLKADVFELESKVEAAETRAKKETKYASLYMPDRWLEAAETERKDGNDELAIQKLRVGLTNISAGLSTAALELADHHAGLIADEDGAAHLAEAGRMANLARLLAPENLEAANLADEIMLEQQDLGELADAVDIFDTGIPTTDPTEALAQLSAIYDRGNKLDAKGKHQTSLRLYRRGELIAKRAGIEEHWDALTNVYCMAQALKDLEQYQEALNRVTVLLPVHERVKSDEHPDVLATRHLEAQILTGLGRYEEALEKATTLLQVYKKTKSEEHPDVLSTQAIEAQILKGLGRYQEALEKVTALLPVAEKVRGARHPDVIATRNLKAQIEEILQHGTGSETQADDDGEAP